MANLSKFTVEKLPWGSDSEFQRKVRIMISLYAYAYEYESSPLVDDAVFDEYALLIDPAVSTVEDYYDARQRARAEALDSFFRREYAPYTGSWIHAHPEFIQIQALYRKLFQERSI